MGRGKDARVFVETIDSTRDQWKLWNERLGVMEDPPDGLCGSVRRHLGPASDDCARCCSLLVIVIVSLICGD
jgi:hypothetical protein